MQLIKPESSSHFYQCIDGVWTPCYEVPRKDGKGMKPFTLREARTSNPPAVPSVTHILSVINKPGIEAWKQSELIWSALTISRKPTESDEDFVRRVVEEAEQRSTHAKEFGSQVHAAAEAFFANQPIDESVKPYLEQFIAWAKDNIETVIASELICGCPECGYAGRLDLACCLKNVGFAVIDLKSQKIRRDKEGLKQPVFYSDTWPLQLAAYAHTFCLHSSAQVIPSIVSVIIDSSEPGPVYVKRWDDYQDYFDMFKHCIELWKFTKEYDPSKNITAH